MRWPFVVLEKSCWGIGLAGTLGADDAGFGRSFRTRERVEDSKATPSMTTSRVEERACVVASGFTVGGYLEVEL